MCTVHTNFHIVKLYPLEPSDWPASTRPFHSDDLISRLLCTIASH